MNLQRVVITLLALTLAFASQLSKTLTAEPLEKFDPYSAKLISPRAGEVLAPGQHVKITWESTFPKVDLSWCETELFLSLDGGKTFTRITGERNAGVQYFDWIVPNSPSAAAVLDIHFGCTGRYPETSSIQAKSTFVISGKLPLPPTAGPQAPDSD